MKILYVSDLDGTLLTSNSTISKKSEEIINQLIEQGMQFTFASARSIHSASKVTQGLHLQTPLIIYNGAFLIEPQSHKVLYSQFFSSKESCEVLDRLIESSMSPFVYAYINGVERVSYVKGKLHQGGQYYLKNRKNDKRFRVVDTAKQLYEGDIFYITCIDERENLQPLYEEIKAFKTTSALFQQEIYRSEYWLELMPSKASKANAIMVLKEMMQFDKIVSFGDGLNDIPMFTISDECYAVENAALELKKQASGSIGHHDKDAVALWLKAHF